MFAGEESAFCADRALIAFWVGAFACCLTVMFEEQISAGAGIEGRWYLRLDYLLRFAVGHSVVFPLSAEQNPNQDVRAVGRYRRDRCDVGEEQDAVCTRGSNVRKSSELSADLIDRSSESVAEIAAELVLYAHGDLFEAQGA